MTKSGRETQCGRRRRSFLAASASDKRVFQRRRLGRDPATAGQYLFIFQPPGAPLVISQLNQRHVTACALRLGVVTSWLTTNPGSREKGQVRERGLGNRTSSGQTLSCQYICPLVSLRSRIVQPPDQFEPNAQWAAQWLLRQAGMQS